MNKSNIPYYERPFSLKKIRDRNYIENGKYIITDNKDGKYELTFDEFEKAKNLLWVNDSGTVCNKSVKSTLSNYIGRDVHHYKIPKNQIKCSLCGSGMVIGLREICPTCYHKKHDGLIPLKERLQQRNLIRDGIGIVSDQHGLEWIVPLDKFDQVKDTLWHNNGNGDAINGTRTLLLRTVLGQDIKKKRKAFKLVGGEFKYYPCIEDLVIYKATSPSGKVYVGMTNNFENRKKKHERDSSERLGKFHCAINKYGFDSLKWEILHVCNERSEAAKLEQLEIKNYNSFQNGYNMTIGGEGVSGLPINPELEKRRAYARTISRGCKPINVFKKEDLEYVGTWEMKSECEKDLGLKKGRICSYFLEKTQNIRKTISGYYMTTDAISVVTEKKEELLNWIYINGNKGKPKWNKGLKMTEIKNNLNKKAS